MSVVLENTKPHVVLVPSPGAGHVIPLLELGIHLVTHHNFHVSFIVVSTKSSPPDHTLFIQYSKLVDIIELPTIDDVSGHISASSRFIQLPQIMKQSHPSLRLVLYNMKIRPTAMLVDIFGTVTMSMADELGMLKYIVHVTSAWPLALLCYSPTLDKLIEGEYLDQKAALRIPSCNPVWPQDLPKPMTNRKNEEYTAFISVPNEIQNFSNGILVNTWEELESTTLKAMIEDPELKEIIKVPVYAVGPLVRRDAEKVSTGSGTRSELLNWLDQQPVGSVIFAAFGSYGILSAEQIVEMAWALELSQKRFIWVVKPPKIAEVEHQQQIINDNIADYLPQGFLNRTCDIGLVITTWAPQSEILAHPSVGGFFSHCGWNSVLESMANGVPLIAWPLYSEQKMNATMLVEELGVAVRSKTFPARGIIGRDEIESMIRKVMEGENGDKMKARAKEIKRSGEEAMSKGGSSFNAIAEFAGTVRSKCKATK